jgi:hypothetical protein
MSITIHAAATTIAIFIGVGLAAAQNASNHSDLTPTQQRTHNQELASSTSRSAPAAQPQVGDTMPGSITARSLSKQYHRSGSSGKEPVIPEAAGPHPVDRSG